MNYLKFDHVGIVVRDISEGRRLLTAMFRISQWTAVIEDPGIGVYVQFGIGTDGPCYEIVAPHGADSPVEQSLRARKNILNHVAYLVDQLDAASADLRAQGCVPVSEPERAVAYGNNRVQFLISPLGFMIELIEAAGHRHAFARIGTCRM